MDITVQTIKFYEALLRITGDGIVITDETQNIIVVNDAFCSLLGKNYEDVIETSLLVWLEKLDHTACDRWVQLITRLSLTGNIQNEEFRITSGAALRFFSVTASVLNKTLPEDRSVIISAWHDITKLKNMESSLKNYGGNLEILVNERTSELITSNERLLQEIELHKITENKLKNASDEIKDLYNNAPCGYHSLDKDGTFLHINDTELRWLGYTREEVIGRLKVTDILTPKSLHVLQYNFQRFKVLGKLHDIEMEMIRKDGTILPVLVSATAIKDADGNFIMSRSTLYDISERRRLEEQNNVVLLTSIEGFLKIDMEGCFLEVNDSYCNMIGYSRQELLNMRVSDLEALEDIDETKRHIETIISNGFDRFVTKHRTKAGKLLDVEVSINYIKDWKIMFAFIRDITDRKALEKALNEINANLLIRVQEEVKKNRLKDLVMFEQARHLAMGELLMNIAHHWRQPLGAIGAMVQDIQDAHAYKELDDDYLKINVKEIMKELSELSKSIDDFKNFYVQDEEITQFNIIDAVNNALSILDDYLQSKNISVEIDMNESISINGYMNKFSQVILNLLTNIRDVFEERNITNGIIKIRSHLDHQTSRMILTITDNGGGIREDIMEKIFDPYFTTRYRSRGTGLGLYIARFVISNMRGNITARNVDGGSEFRIEI
ncbi:MAG: PAS domain S-box protein [Nitrospirae bacterium]|nr:PAS domain S-box protein [Nitrospirota bacterium]